MHLLFQFTNGSFVASLLANPLGFTQQHIALELIQLL